MLEYKLVIWEKDNPDLSLVLDCELYVKSSGICHTKAETIISLFPFPLFFLESEYSSMEFVKAEYFTKSKFLYIYLKHRKKINILKIKVSVYLELQL